MRFSEKAFWGKFPLIGHHFKMGETAMTNDTVHFQDCQPLLIQGALKSELDLLLNTFEILQVNTVGGFEFFECLHQGRPIVVCRTRIGEINSAIATTLAIQTYHPRLIINQGTAGALTDWPNTGDIVIGTRVCYLSQFSTHADRDADPINPWKSDAYRTVDGDVASYQTSPALLHALRAVCQSPANRVYFDVLGSGDVWTKDPQQIHRYHQQYGVVCESMECAGAYLAANSLQTPLVSIRAISNNELKHQIYDQASGILAQKFVLELLDQL